MNRHYLLFCLFGISIYFVVGIVAREAIVGGDIAEHHMLQYQVSILIADNEPPCGGGIIGDRFVLTAAHCVMTVNEHMVGKPISILAGTQDLSVAGVVIEVQQIFIPKDYKPWLPNIVGDIAVLKLKSPIGVEERDLKVLQMAKNKSRSYAHTDARIAGFGWDAMDEHNRLIGQYSDHRLRFADADVRSNAQCQRDHPNRRIDEKHLCARVKQHSSSRPRGACVGDDGSPLTAGNHLYRHIAIGVLSETVDGCSEVESSGIYTRVSHYRKFIFNVMNNTMTRNIRIFQV